MAQIAVITNRAPSSGEKFYVYEHIRPDTQQIFYVGKGSGPRAFNSSKYHRNPYWKRIVELNGGFEVRKIAENLSEELAFFIEEERISHLKLLGIKLSNMTDGGEGTSGWIKTPEWRTKVGDAHRGKKLSLETREKISKAVKEAGYVHTEDALRKISETHKGKQRALGYRHTDEWKSGQSARAKGNKSRLGQRQSDEEKMKRSIAMMGRPQKKIECPHCRKVGGNSMRRYHFDNCKSMRD